MTKPMLTLDLAAWDAPVDAATRERAVDALEGGQVLFVPRLGFALAPEETRFLSPDAVDKSRKNISLDPATGRLGGSGHAGEEGARLAAMLERYGSQARRLLETLLPGYAPHLQRARTSFRPVEVEQRPQSVRQDDRRLHVDAFPTRPMHGRRILRVFTNVAPDGSDRHWRVGEPFADFAAKFLPRIGRGVPGMSHVMALLRLTKGPRSEYDRIMLALHDLAKRDEAYQRSAPATALIFPPGSTWIVYTDSVLHAAMAGRFAFEQTFHLPVTAMAFPERAPEGVLARLRGA